MPPLGPEILASEVSFSSGTSHSFTLPAFTVAGDLYVVFIEWALSAAVVAASPISGDVVNNFVVTDTPETTWINRANRTSSRDDAAFQGNVWTGSMATVTADEADFTTNVSVEAVCVGAIVNTHSGSSVAYEQGSTSGTNVDHLGDLGFTDVEPQLYVDMIMGALADNANSSPVGTTPSAVPSGYTAEPGGQGSGVAGTTLTHYPISYIAWKSSPSGQSSENPGTWTWPEIVVPGNAATIHFPFSTFSFSDFTPDEEDFPYWGILGAMT
jgi:hypothetical protein